MGRYDRNKLKKSGRYRDDVATDRQSVSAKSKGINIFVVIALVVGAVAVGFLGAKLNESDISLGALIRPFLAEKNEPEQSGDNRLSDAKLEAAPLEPRSVDDGLQELQQGQEVVILPELDSSDGQIREAIIAVAPALSQWLDADHLIRKYMAVVNDFAQGVRVAKHLNFIALKEPFMVEQQGAEFFVAAQSYQRYNNLAQAINAIDIPAMVAVYQRFRPLLLQVFAEFSYPDGYNLDDIFIKAAAEILTAPIIEQPIALVKYSLRYRYADPELEALGPVQKQMLRMGAENTRLIQNKMRMLVDELVSSKG